MPLPLRISEAEQRMARYPADLRLRLELGRLYQAAGRLCDAIREFQRAVAHPHLRIKAMRYLGECFALRGMNDLAMRAFQKALSEKPHLEDKKELLYLLGSVFDRMGKEDEALAQFKRIYEVDIGFRDVATKVESCSSHRSGLAKMPSPAG
jgi:tetratricopeptide (TPR) repeat protein